MSEWDRRVAEFWSAADDTDPAGALAAMQRLVQERPAGDPAALFEWAGVHDFLGLEAQAVPLYQEALAAGLSGPRRAEAVVQLASSLRSLGDPGAAVELLSAGPGAPELGAPELGAAPDAFLALALFDAGRPGEALRVALRALAPTLPQYGRSVQAYADELTDAPER